MIVAVLPRRRRSAQRPSGWHGAGRRGCIREVARQINDWSFRVGGTSFGRWKPKIGESPWSIWSRPFPKVHQMASTIVEKARLGGGMATFTAGGGDEELAEVLTPELIPLRFRKMRMLVHEDGAIPRDGP